MSQPVSVGPPTEGHRAACGVCRRILDWHVPTDADGVGHVNAGRWRHTPTDATADHLPVPLPAEQVNVLGRCDFCGEDTPDDETWIVPVRDFRHQYAPDVADQVGFRDDRSIGAWGACATCVRLVETNQWTALTRRSVTLYMQVHHPELRGSLYDAHALDITRSVGPMHQQVRKNQTGPPHRLVASEPRP